MHAVARGVQREVSASLELELHPDYCELTKVDAGN